MTTVVRTASIVVAASSESSRAWARASSNAASASASSSFASPSGVSAFDAALGCAPAQELRADAGASAQLADAEKAGVVHAATIQDLYKNLTAGPTVRTMPEQYFNRRCTE
jgi:hypothetical protein